MTRRDWWIGVGLFVAAMLLHAAFPRYEWQRGDDEDMIRIDRWSGRALLMEPDEDGRYVPATSSVDALRQ